MKKELILPKKKEKGQAPARKRFRFPPRVRHGRCSLEILTNNEINEVSGPFLGHNKNNIVAVGDRINTCCGSQSQRGIPAGPCGSTKINNFGPQK